MRLSPVFHYIKPLLYFALVCGIVFWKLVQPQGVAQWCSLVGYVTIGAYILLFLYEICLWQYNPFERIPRLAGEYSGTLEYQENGQLRKKPIRALIRQRRLSVEVKTETDQITSRALASSLVEEEGGISLYYIYRTTPRATMEKGNPVQNGACRIFLETVPFSWSRAWLFPKATKKISGKYWTTHGRVGDIVLEGQGV